MIRFKNKSNSTIYISNDDPIHSSCDVIVCSSNNWLKMGTGIAGRLRDFGGPSVQKKCDLLVKKNGGKAFPIGSSVFADSGDLVNLHNENKHIIHAIGMGYKKRVGLKVSGRILATDKSVKMAVKHTLYTAEKLLAKSIFFPLMCSRKGYSVYNDSAAPFIMLNAMLNAFWEHSNEHKLSSLRIYLELKNDELIKCAKEILLNEGYNFDEPVKSRNNSSC